MSEADGVDALLFDVFGTLVDWRGSIARELSTLLPGIDGDAFARAWRGRYQPSMERVRSGARGYVRLDVLHRENLLETLDEFAVTGLDEERIDHLNRVWHRLSPWPDVVEGLARLKKKYILAPCSNANIALMTRLARHGGMSFDTVLGAEPTRSYKPMRETYLGSADLLDLPPERCMMVAAHNDDLAAARACGLKTAFFPRPGEYGGSDVRNREASSDWTFIARDLVDLADRTGC
ncbi:MAG: haloacid dehalogenase type II [Geminicoccaceae bacterium]